MMPAEIQIPRKLANQLLHLAQLSPKLEICGLVSSKNGLAQHCYPINNVADYPQHQFLLDASQQIAAMSQMRELDQELFAIYHSHPTAPAFPSNEDLEQSAYPAALYLIMSLNTRGILEMRGFKITQDSTQEIPLTLIN